MKKSMRDNDRIESVLRKLPKIHDHRSDQTIFLRINEKQFQAKKQKQYRYILILAVAIIFFTLITSALSLDDQFSKNQLSVSQKDEVEVREHTLRQGDDVSPRYNVLNQTEIVPIPNHDVFSGTLKRAAISAAFEAMRQGGVMDNTVMYTIPESVQFAKIEEEDGQLLVTFSNDTILKDHIQYEMVISAILLTAKDFDYQSVRFQNSNVDSIGPYNLNSAITVPLTPIDEFK